MRNVKRLWVGVMLSFLNLILMLNFWQLVGQAAEVNPNFVDIYNGGQSPNVLGRNVLDGLDNYPTLKSVQANNTIDGKITNKTTQLKIGMEGTIKLKNAESKMTRAYFDVMKKTLNGGTAAASLRSASVFSGSEDNFTPGLFVNSANSLRVYGTKIINVKINPKTDFPIYVGFRIILNENDPSGYTYQLWKVDQPNLTPPTLEKVYATDTSLKGTGESGYQVTATVNGETKTALVATDGHYQLDFTHAIGTTNKKVTVTEMEDPNAAVLTGAQASVDGQVLSAAAPTISPTAASIDYTADDLNDLEGKSQQEVVNWIAQKANLKATGADNLVFTTESADTLQALKAAQKSGTTELKIYAQTKEGQKSSAATVTANYAGGTLAFGAVPEQVDFGTFELPRLQSQKHWLANSSQLVVRDTRTGAKHWQLSAKLIKSVVNGQPFKGQLCYQDAEHPLSTTATLIKTGQGVGNESIQLNGLQGLYLNVQPHNLAGTYAGEIEWTLQDVPE